MLINEKNYDFLIENNIKTFYYFREVTNKNTIPMHCETSFSLLNY
jgi:hypothetical protein